MRYSWAFVLRVRPEVARDLHVRQLAAYLLAEAGQKRQVMPARPIGRGY